MFTSVEFNVLWGDDESENVTMDMTTAEVPMLSPPPLTKQLITHFGYPAEEHMVRTDDGYFLCLQRIPHSKAVCTCCAPALTLRVRGARGGRPFC